jgi:bacterioferritin (cytochrome b1)
MKKSLSVSLPFVTVENIIPDKNTVKRLSFLYAGKHGELNAVLQYVYHYFYFIKFGEKETADVLMDIALSKMERVERLGSLLLNLGVDPICAGYLPFRCNFYRTDSLSYSKNIEKMLLDDISGALVTIDAYNTAINEIPFDEIKALLIKIKFDEESHVKTLNDRLLFHSKKRRE